jgi:hypothetical protein
LLYVKPCVGMHSHIHVGGHFMHQMTGREEFHVGRGIAPPSQEFFPLQSEDLHAQGCDRTDTASTTALTMNFSKCVTCRQGSLLRIECIALQLLILGLGLRAQS